MNYEINRSQNQDYTDFLDQDLAIRNSCTGLAKPKPSLDSINTI